MNPLLELHLVYNDKIDLKVYKRMLDDFLKLWGMDLHIYLESLPQLEQLDDFFTLLDSYDLGTYSIFAGVFEKRVWYIDQMYLNMFDGHKLNALAVPIFEGLEEDSKYNDYIELIKQSNVKLELYYQLDFDNYLYLSEIERFCINRNIKQCIVNIDKKLFAVRDYSKDYKNILLELLKKNEKLTGTFRFSVADCPQMILLKDTQLKDILGGCCGGITSCAVQKSGDITICLPLDRMVLGNITEDSIELIWEKSELLGQIRDRKNIKGGCSKCDFLISCGGCRASSYFKNKDLLGEDPSCWNIK